MRETERGREKEGGRREGGRRKEGAREGGRKGCLCHLIVNRGGLVSYAIGIIYIVLHV
jgi:hypothetical protein